MWATVRKLSEPGCADVPDVWFVVCNWKKQWWKIRKCNYFRTIVRISNRLARETPSKTLEPLSLSLQEQHTQNRLIEH